MTQQLTRPAGCGAGEPWPRDALILEASIYATRMHAGQVRKYTGDLYVVHCFEVANNLPRDATDVMLAAAILHDTVEDTEATIEDINREFGPQIGSLVYWLTDASKPEDGNRATRKAIDREHIAKAPAEAKTIKLADLISNTRSIVQFDPSFAKVYLAEKALLLPLLIEGDAVLHSVASGMVARGRRELGL